MRLFTDELLWVSISDGTHAAMDIFSRHYSFRKWRNRKIKNGMRISGPGERIILISPNNDALFIWKKEKFRMDGQVGINCSVFRNESKIQSSKLIAQAEEIALYKWPGERMFTYVDAGKIKSPNPGYCFKMNGWRQCGVSSKNLIILEKLNN